MVGYWQQRGLGHLKGSPPPQGPVLPALHQEAFCGQGGMGGRPPEGNIPPAPWATDGLEVVATKLPLYLPSPRALDPARLEVALAHIAFAKVYELPSN